LKIRLQRMVRNRVRDRNGKVAGRIHSVRAEIRGGECVILEWQLGPAAMLSRLGISAAGLIGWPLKFEPLRIPWNELDLSDPNDPRLTRSIEELRTGP
jgi:hypothetical protein